LIDHQQILSNEVYIGGDSYSGISIPVIVQEISQGNLHLAVNLVMAMADMYTIASLLFGLL